MDETPLDPHDDDLGEWRTSLAEDRHFPANVDMLAERATHGGVPVSSGSLTDRLARLSERRDK